jgi:hypothetical protein
MTFPRSSTDSLASVLPRLCTHLERDQGLEITISIKEGKKKQPTAMMFLIFLMV